MYETSISAEARMCANRTTKPGKADRKINKMMVWFQRQKDSKSKEKWSCITQACHYVSNTHWPKLSYHRNVQPDRALLMTRNRMKAQKEYQSELKE